MKNLSRFRPQRHGQHLLDLVDPIEKLMIVTQKKVARGISQTAVHFAAGEESGRESVWCGTPPIGVARP